MSINYIESDYSCKIEEGFRKVLFEVLDTDEEPLREHFEQNHWVYEVIDIDTMLREIANTLAWNIHEEIDHFMSEDLDYEFNVERYERKLIEKGKKA